jgi:hypothetical protein
MYCEECEALLCPHGECRECDECKPCDEAERCMMCGKVSRAVRRRINLPGKPTLCRKCFDHQMGDEPCD